MLELLIFTLFVFVLPLALGRSEAWRRDEEEHRVAQNAVRAHQAVTR